MEYSVYRDPKTLDSTGYMEIGPGRYSGKHWQQGFLFVWEDAFSIAEGIFTRHFTDYDHFAMNDIPRDSGLAIASDLRYAAILLNTVDAKVAIELLSLPEWARADFSAELVKHRDDIQVMLNEIASTLEQAYQTDDYACVLGM